MKKILKCLMIISVFVPWITTIFFLRRYGSWVVAPFDILALVIFLLSGAFFVFNARDRRGRWAIIIVMSLLVNWFTMPVQRYIGDYLYFKQREANFNYFVLLSKQNPKLKELAPDFFLNDSCIKNDQIEQIDTNHLMRLLNRVGFSLNTYKLFCTELKKTDCFIFYVQDDGVKVFVNDDFFGRDSGFAYSTNIPAPQSIGHRRYYWHKLAPNWFVWYFN